MTPFRWTRTGQDKTRQDKGWKPPKVGVCTWEKCPRIRASVCLARDTAIFPFQPAGHIRGPDVPILGPMDTVSGPHGSKHGQKATQTVPKSILSITLDNGTFWGPPRRHRGPFFGDSGPFQARWGPTCGPPRARPLGRMEHFGGPDTGLPGPKGDCFSSQHHPG